MNPLIGTEELTRHPEWRVFDCRHDLYKPEWGPEQYPKGHIPGALFVNMEHDLSGKKTGANGRHPLPSAKDFAAWAGRQGLTGDEQVVCYDQSTGGSAARLWWMLRWIGHEKVAVLDGGFAKWTKEQRPVTTDVPAFKPVSFTKTPRDISRDVGFVQKLPKNLVLLDARAPARYRGEQEPIDPVAGHIPGALNRFNADNLQPDGTFKPAAVLKAEWEAVLGGKRPEEVVHYCGSGVSACHNLLAMEAAGLTGGTLYAGSWSEWIADPARPRAP